MAARDELLRYGYTLDQDGKYRRHGKSTQVWQEVDGGWLRFDPDGQGHEVPEPHSIKAEYAGTSGLNKLKHPTTFNWVYPEAEVEKIYRVAVEFEAERLRKAMERKNQLAAPPETAARPTPTDEQVNAMREAQATEVKVPRKLWGIFG